MVMSQRADAVFRSLSDATRRGLFERLLRDGELTVGSLTRRAGVSQPAVSRHLGVLRRAGLVEPRRAGRETHYRARPKGLRPLHDWMTHYAAFWEDRLDQLESLLDRMDK